VVERHWIFSALKSLESLKVEHRNYLDVQRRISAACAAMFRGELLVIVGPSRVGKTRCVRDGMGIPDNNKPESDQTMRIVIVEAANEGTSAEFSTKGFAMACLRAIRHPVYGVADKDDPWEQKLNERLDRTPERRLWSAFESALVMRRTEFLVVDEAHHVRYVRGGDQAAARVLDSWKCLANKTKVKLVLTGSYSLLNLLSLAPHLLGRQQPIEFARYRANVQDDVESWEKMLRSFSELLQFQPGESLSTWNRLLFEGSLGRVGGLSLWVRTALAAMLSDGELHVTGDVLQKVRFPATQEAAILKEILTGERELIRRDGQSPAPINAPTTAPKAKSTPRKTPFRRQPKRSPANGRS
jgi:hypothetical protein